MSAAQSFLTHHAAFGSRLYLDGLDNAACSGYAALPERLFVLLDGVLVYVGGYGPDDYKLQEVRRWLEEYSHAHTRQ